MGFIPLGNLLCIILLSWFQRCEHTPVVLVGGATGSIEDPSGESLEMPELDVETLERNSVGITKTIRGILGKDGGGVGGRRGFAVFKKQNKNKNNYDWLKEMRRLDFLEMVGKYVTVGTMMANESVKKRLESEQGMSYTEFTYQLLQVYDFVYLFLSVQIGGSDQWGNITSGTNLIQSTAQAEGAYGLKFPLLLKSDGT